MRTKTEIIEKLVNPGLIAVVRASRTDQVMPLSEALLAGGVSAVEITMSTPNALQAVQETRARLGERALIGVGTVVEVSTCQAAIDAGAEFIVSPILRPAIAETAHQGGRPVMLGAYTPTEAQLAYEAGSDFIKIFPADGLGPGYIKAIRAPLPHLRIVPTGGVDLDTATEFLKVGCAALGVGSSLVSKDLLETGNWIELTRRAKAFVERVTEFRRRK